MDNIKITDEQCMLLFKENFDLLFKKKFEDKNLFKIKNMKINLNNIWEIIKDETIRKEIELEKIIKSLKLVKKQFKKDTSIRIINNFEKHFIYSEAVSKVEDKIKFFVLKKKYSFSELFDFLENINKYQEEGLITASTFSNFLKENKLMEDFKKKIVISFINELRKVEKEKNINNIKNIFSYLENLLYNKDLRYNSEYKQISSLKSKKNQISGGILQLIVEELLKKNFIFSKHGIGVGTFSVDKEKVIEEIFKKINEKFEMEEISEEDIQSMVGFSLKETNIELKEDFIFNILKYENEDIGEKENITEKEDINKEIENIFLQLINKIDMRGLKEYKILEIKGWILTYLKSDFLNDLNNEDEKFKLLKSTTNGMTLNINRLFEIINERSISFTKENYTNEINYKSIEDETKIFKTKRIKETGKYHYIFDARSSYQMDVLYISPYKNEEKIHSTIVTLDTKLAQEDKKVFLNYFLKTTYINQLLKEEFMDDYAELDAFDIRKSLSMNDNFYKKFSLINSKNSLLNIMKYLDNTYLSNINKEIEELIKNMKETKEKSSNKIKTIFDYFQEEYTNQIEEKKKITNLEIDKIYLQIKSKILNNNNFKDEEYENINYLIESYITYFKKELLRNKNKNTFQYANEYIKLLNKEIKLSYVGGKSLINENHPLEIQNIFKNQWIMLNKTFNSRYIGYDNGKEITISEDNMEKLLKNSDIVFDKEITKGRTEYNVTQESLNNVESLLRDIIYKDVVNNELLNILINNFYRDENNYNSFKKRVEKNRNGKNIIKYYDALKIKANSTMNQEKQIEILLYSINSNDNSVKLNNDLKILFTTIIDEIIKKDNYKVLHDDDTYKEKNIKFDRLKKIFDILELSTVESNTKELLSMYINEGSMKVKKI